MRPQLLGFHFPLNSGCVTAARQRELGQRGCVTSFTVARPRATQAGEKMVSGAWRPYRRSGFPGFDPFGGAGSHM